MLLSSCFYDLNSIESRIQKVENPEPYFLDLRITRAKEVQIAYRLFLVNCYLGFLPNQLAVGDVEWLFFFFGLNCLDSKYIMYIAMIKNNLSIILISLTRANEKWEVINFTICRNTLWI